MPSTALTTGPNTHTHSDRLFDAVFNASLHFRVELDYDNTCRFIERIHRYNDFESGSVLQALAAIDRLIPRRFYTIGNPNNGERRYRLSVGREGSPVLYLEYYEWCGNPPLDDATSQTICREMELTGHADEADCEIDDLPFMGGSRKLTFRFWWD
jgi:hypothetical protein